MPTGEDVVYEHETLETPEHLHGEAIPVRIVSEGKEETQTPDHSSFTTYTLAGTESPFQLLAFTRKRKTATILVQPNGVASPQFIKLAKREQVSNNQGGLVASPATVNYGAEPGVWLIPQATNGAVIVTVIEEWYA